MNGTTPPATSSQPETSKLAISSLVLGILGLCCCTILTAIPGVICGHKALGQIKRSNGTLGGHGLAIGGLITGYVAIALSVFVIPFFAAIAIPNFVHAKHTAMKNACVQNLREIENAKNQWMVENKKKETDVPTEADLKPFLHSGEFPKCPAGGTYSINSGSEEPTCSIPDHHLGGQER